MHYFHIKTTFLLSLLVSNTILTMKPEDIPNWVSNGTYNQSECPICINEFNNVEDGKHQLMFNCGHWICSDCWLPQRCPLCRADIPIFAYQQPTQDDVDEFIDAVAKNEKIQADKFLNYSIDVNAKNRKGDTALHVICNNKLTKRLLDLGANIEAKNAEGITPLHAAIIRKCKSVIATLLNRGATLNSKRIVPFPKHISCFSLIYDLFKSCREVKDEFLKNIPLYANIFDNNNESNNILSAAVVYGSCNDIFLLLSRKIDPNSDRSLYKATQHVLKTELLLKAGADPNVQDDLDVLHFMKQRELIILIVYNYYPIKMLILMFKINMVIPPYIWLLN